MWGTYQCNSIGIGTFPAQDLTGHPKEPCTYITGNKLIEGIVKSLSLKHMSPFPHTPWVLYQLEVSAPEVVHLGQYLISDVNPLFEAQYPSYFSSAQYDREEPPRSCHMFNLPRWMGNRISVEQKEVSATTDTKVKLKDINYKTGIVMTGDYIPHQWYELEDVNVTLQTRKKLEELIWKCECIVSKHTNYQCNTFAKNGNWDWMTSCCISTICTTTKTSLLFGMK